MAVKQSRRALVGTIGSLALAPGILALPVTANPAEAAPAESGHLIFITADLVQGSRGIPPEERAMRSCIPQARFPRNTQMVFRARIIDPLTGEAMDDSTVESAQVNLANGITLPMRFRPERIEVETFWTTSWIIPKDYPTGTLNHTVTATAVDGRTGEWRPFNLESSMTLILDEVWPDPEA